MCPQPQPVAGKLCKPLQATKLNSYIGQSFARNLRHRHPWSPVLIWSLWIIYPASVPCFTSIFLWLPPRPNNWTCALCLCLKDTNTYIWKKNNILLKYNLWGSQTRLCSVTAAQLWTDFNQLIRRRWRRIRRQVTRLCEFWYHNAICNVLSVSFQGTEFRTSSNE